MNRRTIIGIMGGDHTVGAIASEAKLVGAAVTRAERILLTGGCVVENTKVKDAAMTGLMARDAGMSVVTVYCSARI